jgi:hypothetical protein
MISPRRGRGGTPASRVPGPALPVRETDDFSDMIAHVSGLAAPGIVRPAIPASNQHACHQMQSNVPNRVSLLERDRP